MPSCSLKDLLETPDGTKTWAPLVATVTKAPQTAKSSPGARGETWTRISLTIADATAAAELVWSDPTPPYLGNPKMLEGKSISLAPGAYVETYKDARRIRAKGNEVVGADSPPAGAPQPTSSVPAASYAPPVNPGAAHPLMGPDRALLTDRALLEAYAAWAPKLWAILDPGLQAAPGTAQAVAACLNTMTIAVGQGKLAVTMFAEEEE